MSMKKTSFVLLFGLMVSACGTQTPAAEQKAPAPASPAQAATAAPAQAPGADKAAAPAAPGDAAQAVPPTAGAQGAAAQPAAAASKVARIVVLEKQECCDCTRTRQEKSWAALQEAMKAGNFAPETVKIFTDTQAEEAGLYTALKPMMVQPAYYFLDAKGDLIEMLQGELEQDAITKILATAP